MTSTLKRTAHEVIDLTETKKQCSSIHDEDTDDEYEPFAKDNIKQEEQEDTDDEEDERIMFLVQEFIDFMDDFEYTDVKAVLSKYDPETVEKILEEAWTKEALTPIVTECITKSFNVKPYKAPEPPSKFKDMYKALSNCLIIAIDDHAEAPNGVFNDEEVLEDAVTAIVDKLLELGDDIFQSIVDDQEEFEKQNL